MTRTAHPAPQGPLAAGVYYATPQNPRAPLPVLAARLRTEVVDLTAHHTLTQVFCNPVSAGRASRQHSPHIAEARYTFPLYEGSAVTAFAAQVAARLVRGAVRPRAEARAVYAAAQAAGKQAALLEQSTAEVFTARVGSIPAGAFVTVVIKYAHELQQDLEAGGVRLVIPTAIAPRYGWLPPDSGLYEAGWASNWSAMSPELEAAAAGRPEATGIAIEVLATMAGAIRSVQSASHPIAVDIGTHAPAPAPASAADFSPQKARATLALSSPSLTGLDKDFSLTISSADPGAPRAFLSAHPTLPDTSTLMVTLVPKFALPPIRPEVVFVVDRSGSMGHKIPTVKSALHLFLASLPGGTHFNIISFGSTHSALWPSSRAYTAETLQLAKKHIDTISANLGGTEMLPPIQTAVQNRLKSLPTEVLVLTDGEIWHTDPLFNFITAAAEDGAIRFFTLGVGNAVSHLLVEGIARAGRGYAQVVAEGEGMQRKLMRMLKAALTPHVNDWSVDWEGKAASLSSHIDPPTPTILPPVSLYDPTTSDSPPAPAPLPPVSIPPILQAPATIPPLFPYTRTTVYFTFTTPPPASVALTGTARTPSTTQPLQLSIPITPVAAPLHHLFGRKLLQDLEEGHCAYLPREAAAEVVAAEGTRVGVLYGLASRWTSFVAVDEEGDVSAEEEREVVVEREVVMMERRRALGVPMRGSSRRTKQTARKATGGMAPRMRATGEVLPSGGAASVGGMRGALMGMRAGSSAMAAAVDVVMADDDGEEEGEEEGADPVGVFSRLQLFSGLWELSGRLLKALECDEGVVKGVVKGLGGEGDKEKEGVFATVLVLAYLRAKLQSREEEWEMMADKARASLGSVGEEELGRMEKEAEGLVSVG